MKEQKKWSDMTPSEKKRFSCMGALIAIVVLVLLLGYLVNSSKSEDRNYIYNLSWNDITDPLRESGYRIDDLKNDTMYWWNCQPKDARGWKFTDRIQLCGNDPGKISAIRIEAITFEEKNGLTDNKDALEHFVWIGSFLPDSAKACAWIRRNFNVTKADIMIDEYTKLQIMAPVKDYRRLDIFKVDEQHAQSPIPVDSLFWYKE